MVKAITSTPIYYTGIGSRETPEPVLYNMCLLAELFSSLGLILRSGGAKGADRAFEIGSGGLNVIYTEPDPEYVGVCDQYVRRIHPNYNALDAYALRMHQRNIHQILGDDPTKPILSKFVVYYSGGIGNEVRGGTRTAVELARLHGIPNFNLRYQIDELINYIDGNLNVHSELKGYKEWLHLTHPHL